MGCYTSVHTNKSLLEGERKKEESEDGGTENQGRERCIQKKIIDIYINRMEGTNRDGRSWLCG